MTVWSGSPTNTNYPIRASKIAPGAVEVPTFYEIPAGLPGTGNANMVIQGPDLSAINSNSTVLLSLGGEIQDLQSVVHIIHSQMDLM